MRNKLIVFVATGFGWGMAPKAPGTFGTVFGLALALLFPDNLYLLLAVCFAGIWISHEAEKLLEEHDSPKIVIDEIAGYLVAAFNWHGYYLLAAFLLFRVFDIIKPEPIHQLQKLPGGFGVMADDLAAGLLTNLVLWLTVKMLPF
ncbi:MAG: phosphatidylglycerophosphatase A [Thermincola sp.]|jgi:phosphatidylglycerophosphatase A|nr:phosphatidylglycerophosphatase A [Thermincola sp.]MDT3701677.1 phosphatidylglycerophosphatase A [Thermincola sp.]